MQRAAVALYTAGGGVLVHLSTTVGAMLADQQTGDASIVIPVVNAGGSVSIVGALVYLVKQLVDGKLVTRRPAEVEAELMKALSESQALVAEGQKREHAYEEMIRNFWKAAHHD